MIEIGKARKRTDRARERERERETINLLSLIEPETN